MSLSITRTGLIECSGTGITENLQINSKPISDSGWSNASNRDVVTKNGYSSIHFVGAMGSSKSSTGKFTSTNANNYIPAANEVISFSADVWFENVVLGTTNAYIDLYQSGATIDGSWRGTTAIRDSGHWKTYNSWYTLDPDKLNGKGWIHIWKTFKYLNYTYPAIGPCLYARDFTGDVYFKNIKFERSDYATPWTPSPSDNIYTSNIVGFIEEEYENPIISMKNNTILANIFYEY